MLSIQVENIKCGGCAHQIQTSLLSIDGVDDVWVNVENGTVSVQLKDSVDSQLLQEHICSVLLSKGYPEVGTVEGLEAMGVKAKSFVSCAIGKLSK